MIVDMFLLCTAVVKPGRRNPLRRLGINGETVLNWINK